MAAVELHVDARVPALVGVNYVANILAHADAGVNECDDNDAAARADARVRAHFLRARMTVQQWMEYDNVRAACDACADTVDARRHAECGWLDAVRCVGCGARMHMHCALRRFVLRLDTACARCATDWCPGPLRPDAVRATARAVEPECGGRVLVRMDLDLQQPPMDAAALLSEASATLVNGGGDDAAK